MTNLRSACIADRGTFKAANSSVLLLHLNQQSDFLVPSPHQPTGYRLDGTVKAFRALSILTIVVPRQLACRISADPASGLRSISCNEMDVFSVNEAAVSYQPLCP